MSDLDYTFCLTSYPERFANLPKVLASLWAQKIHPSRVVLTLARDEYAAYTEMYQEGLDCDVLVIEKDVKVYKKFLYAMEKYEDEPFSQFVCVDDDYEYDPRAVELLLREKMINNAIAVSGNNYWHNGFKCHCGALSLVCPFAFEGWRNYEQYFGQLDSSDMFYTMLAAKNRVVYESAGELLESHAKPIESKGAYTKPGQVQRTYMRVAELFGWLKL